MNKDSLSYLILVCLVSSFIGFNAIIPVVTKEDDGELVLGELIQDDWIIEGNKVYLDDSNVYLSAKPHTIGSSGWVEFELNSKNYEGDIDLIWGFNSTNAVPSQPHIWRNFTHYEDRWDEINTSIDYLYESVNSYENLGIENYDNYTVDRGNKFNTKLFRVNYSIENDSSKTEIVAFNQYQINGDNIGIRYNQTALYKAQTPVYYEDWKSISNNPEIVNRQFKDINKWYIYKDIPVQSNKLYKAKCWVDVPFSGLNRSQGKYWWAVKPSGMTLDQAIDTDTLYYLDPWWDASWTYFVPITIDGSYIKTDLDYFPVLVTIPQATSAKCDDGKSIRFVDEDNSTEYYYEVEDIDNFNNSGENYCWVNITSLTASTDFTFLMYYGNSGASSTSDPSNVFSYGYDAVYHMNESSVIVDSAGLSPDGFCNSTSVGSAPADTVGQIGNGTRFDGSDDYYAFGDVLRFGCPNYDDTTSWTISLWFSAPSGFDYEECWWTNQDASAERGLVINGVDSSREVYLNFGQPYAAHTADATNGYETNWVFYTIRYDTNSDRLVTVWDRSATAQMNVSKTITNSSGYAGSDEVNMGRWKAAVPRWYRGDIDEFRVSIGVARSESWLDAEYNTSYAGDFISFGGEVAGTVPAAWNAMESWNGSIHNVTARNVQNFNDNTFWFTINEAVENATDGDQIYCNATIYYENVILNKPITLLGAGVGNTTINGSMAESTVNITDNGINLSNFTIKDGSPSGVCIGASQRSTLENLSVSNCSIYGIGMIVGAGGNNFDYSIIRNCNSSNNGDITASGYNIYIDNGDYISLNNVTANSPITIDNSPHHGYGIYLKDSDWFTIANCEAHIDNTDPAVAAPNETLNYLDDCDDGNISYGNFSGGWQYGWILQYSDRVDFHMNTFEHDEYGIYVDSVNAINITYNDFINCSTNYGVWREGGDGGYFYYNNFYNCTGGDNGATGIWYNHTLRSGNWHSAYDNNSEGAYDNDSNGRADTPYLLPGGGSSKDKYPLMVPYAGVALDPFFEERDTWNGSLFNISSFNNIEIWNGSLFNISSFTSIDSINGSIFNISAVLLIEAWNGSIFNDSNFILIEQWNGSIFNISAFIQIESNNGSIFNISRFILIETLNGSIYNATMWNLLEIWNGSVFNLSASAGMVCFINGVNINCSSSSSAGAQEYRWQVYVEGEYGGDTGWCPDCTDMSWTFEDGGHIEIRLSINDSIGQIISSTQTYTLTTEDSEYIDTHNASEYDTRLECIEAGFHWWDGECHNCTRPLPWNEKEEHPPAVDDKPPLEISKPVMTFGVIIFFLIIAFILYFRYKGRKKK